MSHECVVDLILLGIHRQSADKVDFEEVMNHFERNSHSTVFSSIKSDFGYRG